MISDLDTNRSRLLVSGHELPRVTESKQTSMRRSNQIDFNSTVPPLCCLLEKYPRFSSVIFDKTQLLLRGALVNFAFILARTQPLP
jgi:hypothetical protein